MKIYSQRIKNIYLYRHSLWDIAVRQLKARYSSSILGIWLAIINPLLIMLAITFVFTVVFRLEIKNFPLFALSGIFPWMFFSNALFEASCSILNQQNVLRQFNLPREIIPLSSILSNFLNFLIGWCIIYPLFLFFNPKIILLLPLLIIVLLVNLLFVCGLGLALSVLNVLFRDIGHLLAVIFMFWFWITPIFYSVDMIPVKFVWICNFNPMTTYIVYFREITFNGSVPDVPINLGIFGWAILSLILGLMIFSHYEPKLLKQI